MCYKYIKVVLVLLIICAAANESSAQVRMVISHSGPPGSLYDLSARHFAQRVERRLRGQVHIEFSSRSILGSERTQLRMLQAGQLSMMLSSSISYQIAPEFQIFDLPFLVRDREHVRRMEQDIVRRYLDQIASEKGYIILGVWEDGFRQIANNRAPIRDLSDLKGLRLRTPKNEWRFKTFQYLGATPTPIPSTEMYTALQRGVIDGMEISVTQIEYYKIYQIQRFLSITNHVYIPAYLLMSRKIFNDLDRTTQNALMEAANETRDFIYSTAERLEREALRNLRNLGMMITDVDTNAFRSKSKRIYDEFARSVKMGSEMISRALRLY